MVVIILFGIWAAVFLVGLGISAVSLWLTLLALAKRRPFDWWVFGAVSVTVLLCALLFLQSRPSTINLPDSVDFKNMVLNSFGYGVSLGVAVLVGGLVSWIAGWG